MQVRQVCCTVGPQVRKISAWSPQISHLHLLPNLTELDLRLVRGSPHRKCSPLLPWIDLAPLSSLQQLRQLSVHTSSYQPLPFGHLEYLTQLKSMSLDNVVPLPGLPPNITQLSLGAARSITEGLPEAASNSLRCFEGKLSVVSLHMSTLANNPAKLRHIPSIKDAAEVRLEFASYVETVSKWCPYHFTQLAVLHLNIQTAAFPFVPQWDLSTCNLQQFCLTVTCSCRVPDLRGLVHVFADDLQLHFTKVYSKLQRCLLNCLSWKIQHADLWVSPFSGCAEAGIPRCVTDAAGTLMLSQGGPPHMEMNGLPFAEAAAKAAAAVRSSSSWSVHRASPACNVIVDSGSDSDDE